MASEMTLEPCPFCGKEGPFDQWPCDWLDGKGGNVVRCPCCHGAAPLATWNRRAHLAQPAQAVDVYDLAAEIRRVDSNHNLSSLALAEALAPFLTRALSGEKAGPVGDDKVLWGVVANAGRLSKRRQVRWAHVSDATGQGSNASAALCRRFGFDPDEEIPASPTPDKEGK